MRGLKIQHVWIRKILSGEKTMEVRSRRFNVLGQRIALGNSKNGLVEGYATIQEIIKIPLSKVSEYEDKHLASELLLQRYCNKNELYGYFLKDVQKENKPFLFPKSASIWFTLE